MRLSEMNMVLRFRTVSGEEAAVVRRGVSWV